MFSSFHLHPHDCSAVSKFIVTPTPTSHSPAKHVHINTKSYSQLKPCCDLNIHTSSRQDNLNQILNNFIKMNKLQKRNESQKQHQHSLKKKQSNKSLTPTKLQTPIQSKFTDNNEITTSIIRSLTPEKENTQSLFSKQQNSDPKQQQQQFQFDNSNVQFKENQPKQKKEQTKKLKMKEQFYFNYNFENLNDNQKNILWKLQQLIHKADGVQQLCSQIKGMIKSNQDKKKEQLLFPQKINYDDQNNEGINLNTALHAFNDIIENETIRLQPKQSQTLKVQPSERSMSSKKTLSKKTQFKRTTSTQKSRVMTDFSQKIY